MLHKSLKSSLILLSALCIPYLACADNATAGSKLFKVNCAICHSTGSNRILGPGLEGVTVRVPSADWMLHWIKNNVSLRKSGDAYARQIFTDNNGALMPVFENTLTNAQINDIITFLRNPAVVTASDKNSETGHLALGQDESGTWLWPWIVLSGVLFLLITILRSARVALQITVSEKKNIPIAHNTSIWFNITHWAKGHKLMVALLFISFFSLSTVYGWEYLWNIHVTPGYHPSQPIAFIHKVHADDNGIACLYCHSGAEKGKVAGIPTLNVCMNCHNAIIGSTPEYKKEIAKIYYAVGWDTVKRAYINEQHPIKWNRVHSLPDFTYFNHAQHVVIGKISCQKCHGDCSSFTTNMQYASLTMGWCINCHRETPVQMNNNGYYSKLHSAIEKKFGSDKVITVADMGGLECGKCHY